MRSTDILRTPELHGQSPLKLCDFGRLVACLIVAIVVSEQRALADEAPIDLSCWMLTLPTDLRKPGYTDEIEPTDLQSFERSPWFTRDANSSALRFRAHCGGVTTRNSGYPRCELREWDKTTDTRAAWSTDSGRHEMKFLARILAVPKNKRHAVCGQIHDADDDVLMIRLEDTKLFIERNETPRVMLTRKYALGDPVDIRMVATGGQISVWYNGEQVMDWELNRDGCFFKAGCYTLSNPKRGDTAEDFAEVLIETLAISH